MSEPNAGEDDSVDLVLRHVSQRFPEDLARAMLGPEVSSAVPYETQLDARQRRLDRTLDARVGEERRLLHIEWQNEMTQEVPFRIFEYHVMLALAAAAEALEKKQESPRIESVLVLLSGREEPWPAYGAFRTSSEDGRFSGVHYRIEAVYQSTVADLEARGSLFWLMFAPLTVDADTDKLRRVVESLRANTPPPVFDAMGTAMAVLAEADGRGRGLRNVIRSLLPRELVMKNWIYQEGREAGRLEGLEAGRVEGLEAGRVEGLEAGRVEGLGHLFERRLRRALSAEERERLVQRVRELGADRVVDAVLDLSPNELASWLCSTPAH